MNNFLCANIFFKTGYFLQDMYNFSTVFHLAVRRTASD
jgi:hypothetical protein